jgi:molecular chaperone HtpG
MKPEQKQIYYILGDDIRSVVYSPHLDLVRGYDYEVLLLTDPVDAFMLVRLNKYKDYSLANVATADLKPPVKEAEEKGELTTPVPEGDFAALLQRIQSQLGDRVAAVRMTDRLVDSPARLADPEGAPQQELQRVYRILKEDFQPPKKVLELNPGHPIIVGLNSLSVEDELGKLIVEQVYEDALLVEGLHPDPVGMIPRIQQIMKAALK